MTTPTGGITASDIMDVRVKFEALGLEPCDARFHWSDIAGRWEVETALGVFVAHQDNGWQ